MDIYLHMLYVKHRPSILRGFSFLVATYVDVYGVSYPLGTKVPNVQAHLTLYAQWQAIQLPIVAPVTASPQASAVSAGSKVNFVNYYC